MFYLRHGDDQATMFNAKCQVPILLNFVKTHLQIPRSSTIDFLPVTVDPKLLVPLGLPEKGETVYANTALGLRASYILVLVREDEDGAKEYVLQWKGKPEERDKILALLEARNAEEKKKAAAAKGKGAKK